MEYKVLDNDDIEIIPGEDSIEKVLEEMARQSYKTPLVRTPLQRGTSFPLDEEVRGGFF